MSSQARSSIASRTVVALVLSITAIAWNITLAAELPAAQTVAEGGVSVKVIPWPVNAASALWEFEVTLDTHSQELSDDLVASSVLVLDGVERKPLRWRTTAVSGHHRSGVLSFAASDATVRSVELRIQRSNEPKPRVFHWAGSLWQP